MDGNDTDAFLRQINPGLLKYKEEFEKLSVTNNETLRFLRPNEVLEMNLPVVYKRMLIDKIVNLQTPDTKMKMKESIVTDMGSSVCLPTGTTSTHKPKRLKFDEQSVESVSHIGLNEEKKSDSPPEKSNGFLLSELSRLKDERDTLTILLSHKKDELNSFTHNRPDEREPIPIPGNPVTKFICDKCHRRGHRTIGNKGNKDCPFLHCEGYQICGLQSKHPEYKSSISEANKEIHGIEKRLKSVGEEITSINTFLQHNTTNFVNALRPHLKACYPQRYIGQEGQKDLQKDIRLIKIACNGRIPSNLTKENIESLLIDGRTKVGKGCNKVEQSSCTSVPPVTFTPSTCMQSPIPRPATEMQSPTCMTPQMLPNYNWWPWNYGQFGMYPQVTQPVWSYNYPAATATATAPSTEIFPPLPADLDESAINPPLPPDEDL